MRKKLKSRLYGYAYDFCLLLEAKLTTFLNKGYRTSGAIQDGLRGTNEATCTAINTGKGVNPVNPLGLPRNACNRTTLSAGRTTNTELWNDFKRHVPSTEYVVEVRNAIYRADFQKSINLNRVTPLVGQLSTKEYFFLRRGAAQGGD